MSDNKNKTTLVLGAGVIGVTTAYYLARAGLDVTVVDRQDAPGMETSFANGGQIAASHAEPWATPSALGNIIKWLGRTDAPLKFRLKADPVLWNWCIRFLVNCTAGRVSQNIERTLRVALYSRASLIALRAEIGIEYDQRTDGVLHFYGQTKDYDRACKHAETMRGHGFEQQLLSGGECVSTEPALVHALDTGQLAGGILASDDESGDAHAFTKALAGHAADLGVKFRYGCDIERLLTSSGAVTGVELGDGEVLLADATVLALGSYSPLLLRPLGIHLPIYPAKGYSVTLPIIDANLAPKTSLTENERKLVYSRLGSRLRIAGTAEIAGYNTDIDTERTAIMLKAAAELLPGACDLTDPDPWAGLRAKTPDSVPVLGMTPIKSLYLNTGHGTLGWTMSCGSGRAIADLVSGRTPDIDLNGLAMDRF
ncbi:MAG: D-amino acid dehydrogenase [Rhodospirillaceae bacterium]|nr:D-amino acid dehydrogenase [Rhodospirillaceae bacterium]MBT4463191.1 D-amino acid dehydrogenase [Rhodospirillaceae bacterium]MBT5013444.1 D-amino acid dehydrogenase [Rhodospirillaceae bacterium]MBT5309796.1 D-amino acid dehydrogenase [Rhodospirillaceae bacterium]MBT6407824.1 D-amino acid dehydrogenase [Rhodospirillaceae bacterium]